MYSSQPLSVWFIGLPCSGKTTLSQGVNSLLLKAGTKSTVLDGDDLRKGINNNLGFSLADRYENIRRVAEINKLFLREGFIVLNALICPMQDMRDLARNIVGTGNYLEFFVNAPMDICEQRDIKGMYKKARAGEISNFTGIDSPFEPPANADVVINSNILSIEDSVEEVYNFVKKKVMIN
jgi:adenylylsulfate kinase